MLQRSTIQLLRFHFSLFLLPVYLFAICLVPEPDIIRALLVFFILHILVYPSSNGYNSYMDRDDTPIGGLKNPLQPSRQLFYVTVVMDVIAIALSTIIGLYFTLGVIAYILASRAYSYRGIRLKKYAIAGYLVVVIFQGALVFFICWNGINKTGGVNVPIFPMLAAACLIGGYYPLTQIYQHEADKKDGVHTISMLLGKRGTFIFCGCIFVAATLLMFITFNQQNQLRSFYIFTVCMLPMVLFFMQWMFKVWKDENLANFKNSLIMNVLASCCTAICFLIIIIMKGFE